MTMTTALDEQDQAILTKRITSLQAITTPTVGDFVRFTDGIERRISHVWDFGDDSSQAQTSDGGSYYLGDGYVSFSGGLYLGVPLTTLTDTGERKDGAVWFFHHDRWTAHNGIDVSAPFRVWTCSREATR
jgi:hypothetical protein